MFAFLSGKKSETTAFTDQEKHWERIYCERLPDKLSWYQPHLQQSLDLILGTGVDRKAQIIDVGGGASNLVDDLFVRGFQNITVVDIASSAIDICRKRLEDRASSVKWITGNITEISLPQVHYDLWHDRAVFHFLTDSSGRQKYIENVRRSLKPCGHLIIITFALDGPEQCSGLDVCRYSIESLSVELGSNFELMESIRESHLTPFKTVQKFICCRFVYKGNY